jgi:hypothetical protein
LVVKQIGNEVESAQIIISSELVFDVIISEFVRPINGLYNHSDMKFGTLFFVNLKIALQSIRSNLLRTILTVCIIAVGITALVGILTAIDSITNSITKEFTFMGTNTFTITSRSMHIQVGKNRYRTRNYSYITYYQANEFKEKYVFPSAVSISTNATGTATVKQIQMFRYKVLTKITFSPPEIKSGLAEI